MTYFLQCIQKCKYPGRLCPHNVEPYDLRDVENPNGIVGFGYKKLNLPNVSEFDKFWMNKSNVGQYT